MIALLGFIIPLVLVDPTRAQTVATTKYVGCSTPSSVKSIGVANPSIIYNAAQCRTYCASSASYNYAAYIVNNTSTTNCYCITNSRVASIAPTSYTDANSSPCVTNDAALYDVTTASNFVTCYALANVRSSMYTTAYGATVSSADACLTKCGSATGAFFIPYTSGGSALFGCLCSTEVTAFTSTGTTCGQNTWYRYGNTAATQSGSVLKKKKSIIARRREAVFRAKQRGYACPEGLTACRIGSSGTSWECIDRQNDIGSCGGCLEGAFDNAIPDIMGQDCTRLQGVDPLAVTCSAGLCRAWRCLSGYSVRNGQCRRDGRAVDAPL